jgi:hypothetical protein
MTKLKLSFIVAVALAAFGLAAAPAHALPTRTWVSGKGLDTNPCSLASPCRTFAQALSQTAAGGEIDVLDPAGYGSLTIDKAISIINDGVGVAGLQAGSGGNAITINAGPGDAIHLRGLTIEGAGLASNGIVFYTGGSIDIVHCVIRHFTVRGIALWVTTPLKFSIINTISSDNGVGLDLSPLTPSVIIVGAINGVTMTNNSKGIRVDGSGSATSVTIANSLAANNDYGISYSNAQGTIVDSVVSGSTVDGISVSNNSSVMLRNITATKNSTGVYTYTSTVWLARSTLTQNNYGIFSSGGFVYTYGDNNIDGNATENIHSFLTSIPAH